jgi:hypothetical protein
MRLLIDRQDDFVAESRDVLRVGLQTAARRRSKMRARFDRIFSRRTGFATPDRLLARLHAIKRKISGGTHSDDGRDCRDAFLGLSHHLPISSAAAASQPDASCQGLCPIATNLSVRPKTY